VVFAIAYWRESAEEADTQIDLRSENAHNISDTVQGLNVLNPPSAETKLEVIKNSGGLSTLEGFRDYKAALEPVQIVDFYGQ
jgi:hypothetical protein